MSELALPKGVALKAARVEGDEHVLTEAALGFVADLARRFGPRIDELLAKRADVQAKLDRGERFDFLAETESVRGGDWKGASIPSDLADRRVEITGPVDRKMIINALNSGANVFMADFEDANAPTWANLVTGQLNLRDAVAGTIDLVDPATKKFYELDAKTATLMVRPRGLHLLEKHVLVDGKPVRGSLFDFGLNFHLTAKAKIESGSGPYYYLPKLEHHLEARLWNDVFIHAQEALEIPRGTIRATVLIETLPASFQMDEIIHELREHSAGLNCGRWDYIFSFIKKLQQDPKAVLPDRIAVTMQQHFLRSYTQLVVKTCHRRGVHAIGGMAAQIPIKSDSAANEAALEKVRADKRREVEDGHDGTWVAHPALVAIAKEIFDAKMKTSNQIENKREDVTATPADLLEVPEGPRTDAGLRHNIRVGVQYLEAWLRGNGCVPLDNLMEDAATAEISRAQIWQWIRHRAATDDGVTVDAARFRKALDEELAKLEQKLGKDRFSAGRFDQAKALFDRMSTAEHFEDFLTVPAYELLLATE